MHTTEYKILAVFREKPQNELSTAEIVSSVFPDKHKRIETVLEDTLSGKEKISGAKQELGQLHRNVLHHLNKLVKEGILRVSKEGSKGKKYFVLAISAGEELVFEKHRKRIVISKPSLPAMPIEGHEQKGVVHKFEQATWIDRLNSVLFECTKFETFGDLLDVIFESFSSVNDVLGLNEFETLTGDTFSFFQKLETECEDYGKKVNVIINLFNLNPTKKEKIIAIVLDFIRVKPKNIDIVFNIKSRALTKEPEFFERIFNEFIESKQELHIKNQDLVEAPWMIGRAGPYTFDKEEWQTYQTKIKGKTYGLSCAQSTFVVDVASFLKENKNLNEFRTFIMNVAKSLLSVNSIQRKRSEEFFRNLIKLNKENSREFFMFSRNYIRFWNYGWKQPDIDQDYVLDLIKSTREEVAEFSASEETIYKSVGMPTRFKIAFAPGFAEVAQLSEGKYEKIQIGRSDDINSKEIKEALLSKEKISSLFDGGDAATFYRAEGAKPEDISRELIAIMNTYNLPFFSYDFGGIKADQKLTSFI
ncbi:hypothetical protein ACFLZ7_01375 [Nanoarchaeota archaeon]